MSVTSQVLARLRSLEAAGVEWLPKAEPLKVSPRVVTTPAAVTDPAHETRLALEQLKSEVVACDRCPDLFSTRTQTVFGVGRLSPDLCLIGEAPGADEDKQGEPFVGAAGQLLTKILKAAGFERSDVYICNILKCRPPMNAKPTPDQCGNCKPFLERQIDLVRPKVIACLGGVAMENLLGLAGIMSKRGQWFEYRGIPVMCTYHPSFLLRVTGSDAERARKGECWSDFKAIVERLGRKVAASS